MSGLVCLQGRFVDISEARIALLDRGYLFGDSVFETIRSYEGKPFRSRQHLDRLEHSANVVGINLPIQKTRIDALMRETLRRSGELSAYIRVTLSRGEGGCGISPKDCEAPMLSILVRRLVPYAEEAYREGIRSMVVKTRRVPPACLDPTIKSGNYLPSILARQELDVLGLVEGVQLAIDGHVVSGTVSNLFIVSGNRLRTPDLKSGCLPGITRAAVLQVAAAIGLAVEEAPLELSDLYSADEMFFTNTVMECLPVAGLDSHSFAEAPGPCTRALQTAWKALVERETAGTEVASRLMATAETGR